jgi:DnaJ family protein C protein 9
MASSTAKFQAISAIHSILSDAQTRAFYDETGTIAPSENEESPSFKMWEEYFAKLFPKVTEEDIVKFEETYRFSEEEKKDVLEAYTKYKGNMDDILNVVMLSTEDDEDRFVKMIEEAIEAKKVSRILQVKEAFFSDFECNL